MKQHKWEKLSKCTHGDSGLAFVASLSIVILLMTLALIGVAVLWQASAQAQEPSQRAAQQIEGQQDGTESESVDTEVSEGSSSSSKATDSGESASSESDGSEQAEESGIADESGTTSESVDASSATSDEADDAGDGAEDSTSAEADDTGDGAEDSTSAEVGDPDDSAEDTASAEEAESSDDEADGASSESADSSDKDKDKRTFKREIKLDNGKRYTITVSFDESTEVPANAKLDVVRVMQTPKDYDPGKSEWKDRPTSAERFVSAAEMEARIDELKEALEVRDEDYVFYTEFLDFSLIADGEDVTPAAPAEVIVETNAVEGSASDAIEMSFYSKSNADALNLKNLSGDKAKDKAYKKGAKISFKTEEFTELGIAGVAMPIITEQADGFELTVLGSGSTSAELAEAEVDESVLPEGLRLDAAYVLVASPDRSYGTKLWVEAKAENGAVGETDETEDSADAEANDATSWESSEEGADIDEQNNAASESTQQSETDRVGYLLHEGDLSKLFGFAGTSKPVAVDADDVLVLAQNANEPDAEVADTDTETEAGDQGSEAGDVDLDADEGVTPEGADDDATPAEPQETTTIETTGEGQPASFIPHGILNASSGAYSVKVTYGPDANIPEGSTLEVHELSGSECEIANIRALRALDAESASYSRAFDIKILDAQGNEVEPATSVDVSITLQNAPIMENPSVVHFASDASDVISPETTREKGACTLDFTADGFSVYVVLNANRAQTLTTSADTSAALTRELINLEGSWATWRVVVNSGADSLNGGEDLFLADTFDDKVEGHASQSIDYASINVVGSEAVTYDYSENTGTFVIPDSTAVTITYRTRVTARSGQAVANATFQGTAVLKKGNDGDTIATATATETRTIYPSASDVAGFGTNYMVKLYAYIDGQMQTGVAGAKFILLDANKRAVEYKLGDNAGEPVTFVTDSNGYANVELFEEDGDVSIEKNTAYYLEMIQAPEGCQKDNTLYSFMITDDPAYNSGGIYAYYNGDTMKVRLYEASSGLRVSLRFSGNYDLTQEQQNAVTAVLQKRDSAQGKWEEIERHPNSDAQRGTVAFEASLEAGEIYRVVQEDERPWDLPDGIEVVSTYYCLVGSGESSPESEPQEFYLTLEQVAAGVGVSVVIDNCYEERELSLTKMDKETGDKLKGAVFTVKEAVDDAEVTSYITGENGVAIIRGGEPYVSDTLYYVEETQAPSGYLLPLKTERIYFYFCNDPVLIPTILDDLPEGETAVNLSETYESLSIDNQKAERTIAVMKTWQGNAWPDGVDSVEVGLYQSTDGAEPTAVLDEGGQPRTVTLTKEAPYNNNAFKDLPTRSNDNKNITYSIKEEHIYKTDGTDVIDSYVYVQEYGVSDAGVYIVRNREATGLTVNKVWFDRSGVDEVTDPTKLAEQQDVTFDVYRTSEKIPDDVRADGITYDEMEAFVGAWTKVRSDLSFGKAENWTKTISDLAKKDDAGNSYYYYILETVPSFGDELYEINEEAGTATIKNKVAPDTALLTVGKAKLLDDPRPNPEAREFEFTLTLKKGEHPIRNYKVFSDATKTLMTDWDGEAKFVLTPEHSISLTLPVGVTATVTEAYNAEYTVDTASSQEGSKADDNRTFSYEVTGGNTITYTNTLHVICMVVDKEGTPKPFESLSSALAYIRANPADTYIDGVATIQMLEDYTMPASDVFDVQEDENITLTTASTDTSETFYFKTSRTEPPADTAIITRGGADGSMLTNAGTLTLGKVCLDGDGANISVAADGGLVNSSGTLNLSAETILRNSAITGKGGAIFASGTVNMSGGSITGNSASSGSAIYLGGTTSGTLNMSGGSITGNKDAVDGAVVVEDLYSRVNLSGASIISDSTNARGEAANLYIGADSDQIINVVDPGLEASARIGVTAMAGHREIGEQFAFAEVGKTTNLSRFTNDTYGYRGKLKDGTETNVVWDGLTLKVKKEVDPIGANPNDTFAITLSSPAIKKSNYTIDGTVDYTVTPATAMKPGTIKLNSVRANGEITISPLPVSSYTITENASNYTPAYTIVNTELGSDASVAIADDVFLLDGDSTVTVTNTRRLADVNLAKTMQDTLVGDDSVDFDFTVKLAEADGTPVKNFSLYTNEASPTESIVTDGNGEATFKMLPTNALSHVREFKAPVGAAMTITEKLNSDYRIEASAMSKPASGEGTAIEDKDTDHDNVFAFSVTDDGADVSFTNKRKMAEITLSKKLVGKVSQTESFDFTVTLQNGDGTPAKNYIMHVGDEEWGEIATDENGKATIQFSYGEGEEAETKSVKLVIPEGTSLSAEETVVKKDVGGTQEEIYDTSYSINGGSSTNGATATIESVTEDDTSIAFTNARKMRTVTVTNTVAGYSGNVTPFSFTATVTDGGANDYDANDFTNGVQTFELATGQSKVLTVPYGATLTVEEGFIVGYETLVKHGGKSAVVATSDESQVTENVTVAFTNNQLINIVLENKTSHDFTGVQVYTAYGTKMYRVNDDGTGQVPVTVNNHSATVDVEAGKTAILEVNHQTSQTAEQAYTVKGTTPADGYYYTINNEPSFHEFADPAVLRVYDAAAFEVKGKLRYSTSDSTVTFTYQPLVSFDANGGAWTTEMEGYHDRDGSGQVYQIGVDSGGTVARPQPDPVYPTAEGITFLGWTTDKSFAEQDHTAGEDISGKSYDFTSAVTEPLPIYAVWAKAARDTRIVTARNECSDTLAVTATLNQNGSPITGHALFDGVTTDGNGRATFELSSKGSQNLTVPDGAQLVLQTSSDVLSVSSQYADSDSVSSSFTIDSVKRDGTVTFAPGICKITDANDALLYDESGKPAVYTTLSAAFAAYDGTLYADANAVTEATPAKVKMLVDEYAITSKHSFPAKDMELTTAGKGDADFPYIGTRDRSTLYRGASYKNDSLFTLETSQRAVTLTNIIVDGSNVAVADNVNGSLIQVNKAGSTLNIGTGVTVRNAAFTNYSDGNGARGSIYIKAGTLNVSAGLFANLHARHGGAICAEDNALLIIADSGDGIRFENCSTQSTTNANHGGDGGAIYFSSSNAALDIKGGEDKENPGIAFVGCVAGSNWGDGGAIYAETSKANNVTVTGCSFTECSAKNSTGKNDEGYGGGAIGVRNVNGLTVAHCKFESCDTMNGGGAIMGFVKTNGGGVSVQDCTINNCSCKGQGGAVAVYQDNNNATSSETKLVVNSSTFSNCSSGTNNGSGGAIQCYLPCMEFSESAFYDCWAGKEGGAVNNYFGSSYTAVWSSSYMTVDHCTFVRCRAEDRYDPDALQHYGGGINTKVKTATITNSTFEDCVSTLKEGGALHLGGQGGGSSATVANSTFKGCTAKNGGGALLASAETLTIENSNFYGCSSSASNGGAVYHYKNSRGDSTQKTTTIAGCTFSADPDDANSESCSAAKDGGAVWTRAATVTIGNFGTKNSTFEGCTAGGNGGAVWTQAKRVIKSGSAYEYESTIQNCEISNCIAGGNGGAVYQSYNTSSGITYKGGSITNCQAGRGSAVYLENSAEAIFSDSYIADNIVTTIDDGAIRGGDNSKLYFEGDVIVEYNLCSVDSVKHDVLMQRNNNTDTNMTIIQTTSAGLGGNAHVGVYVPDNVFDRRGTEGKVFGTFGAGNGNTHLEAFFNDRDDGLFGYQASTSNMLIYWGQYLCKITDAQGNTLKRANGADAVYQRLTLALDEFTTVTSEDGETGKAVYIKMLVESYPLQQNESITNFPAANITITTAGSDDSDHPYRGKLGTVCTIFRNNTYSSNNNQLFKLSNADTTLQFENITLDGRKNLAGTQGSYRLIEAEAGRIVVNGGTTFQYGYSGGDAAAGGAIFISNANASLEVNSTSDGNVVFDHCVLQSGKGNGGGAIYSKSSVAISSTGTGKTIFSDCNARRGGAIMVDNNSAGVQLNVTAAEFKNCYSASEGGAIYHNNNNNEANTTIANSSFENCYTVGSDQYSYGGAINAKTANLTVDNCHFTNCYAKSNGGAINHGSENPNRVKTSITNTTFDGCSTTGTNNSYGYGGSVYTQAKDVEMIDCEVSGSKSYNYGGALYCDSSDASSQAVITDSSFENCSVTRTNGYGGAIYSKNKTLTLDGATTINACTAPGFSGAVYMETDNSTLNISGKTIIRGCYANQGGAIYLKNSVTANLEGSPEFRDNGFIVRGGAVVSATKGACFYLEEGSVLNFAGGSPKFSRNIIPGQERVVNGGILDNVRQDVYLAGYSSADATSIHVGGELTGDTIWVWPELNPHRMPNDQFAKIDGAVSDATLNMFRNALADSTTGCSNGEYLAGVSVPGLPSDNAYWDKMYVISFRKIDNKGVTVPGAEFTLFNDKACTLARSSSVSADGETDTGAQGNVLDKGAVEFISVPIGAYYMKETQAPTSFTGSDATYLVLVGSPWLRPTEYNKALWENGGPLDVPNAATLVAKYTTDSGKYYGIFALGADGKADLSKSYASANTGIENIRTDYEAYFMKVDSSGAALPNAVFTIYAPEAVDAQGNPTTYDNGYPKLKLWSRDGGETYPDPGRSADGTTDGPAAVRMSNGNAAPKGLVYFRELPIGTYYLLETDYPERNGNNKITSYVKTDRVLKLVVRGNDDFTLSELLKENDSYTTYRDFEKGSGGYYAVGNTEAACKLTDGSDKLLYELGGDGVTLLPAIYSTLEEGFEAAQTHVLYDSNGNAIADDSALKLKALKDFTLTSPVTYTSSRSLTFTTAERTSKTDDRYVFVTNRTSYTSRAEISRAYDEVEGSNGALITVAGGAGLTLQNISLDGQKATHNGRAVNVESGSSLTIQGNAQLHNFTDTVGSAIYADDGATVTIGGSTITGNVASGADGGAINVGGENARLFFTGAPMVFNNVSSENASEQRNVVLSVDSNEVIRTETGLTGGKIGVYAIDGAGGAIYEAHGRAETPFGTFGTAKNLNAFVNDRNPGLYGVRSETDEGDVLIYWSRPLGSLKIVLRKVQGDSQIVLSGAVFSISRSKTGGPIELDGEKLEGLISNADGVFFVGELNYGDYYLKESDPANRTFKLTVDETGYTVEDA